jgi:hypothetical protein
MTIGILPFPVKGDISTSLVTTHDVLGLSNSSSISVKASWGELCANSSHLIICGLSSWSLTGKDFGIFS